MAKIKVKSPYERFQEEYVAVETPCDNKNGFRIEYVYYANWLVWNLPEKELKKRKRRILLEGVAGALVCLMTAAIPSALNSLPFVAFPAILAICTLLIELFGIGQFFFAKYKTTKSVHETVNRRMRVYPVLTFAFSAAAAVGCTYYTCVYGAAVDRFAVLLGHVVLAALSLMIRKQYTAIPVTTEKNDILHHIEPVMSD